MAEITNDGFQMVTLGAVKEGGEPDIANVLFRFPVPHQQMSIKQAARIDEIKIPGRSGKIKQAVGYEDTEISISITMVDEDEWPGVARWSALWQFERLQAAFRDRSEPVGEIGVDISSISYAVPTIFSIQSRLTDACGIKTVIFKGLDISDTQGESTLIAQLTLSEFEPIVRQVERRKREAAELKKAKAAAGTAAGHDEKAAKAHDDEVAPVGRLGGAYDKGYVAGGSKGKLEAKTKAMGGPPS